MSHPLRLERIRYAQEAGAAARAGTFRAETRPLPAATGAEQRRQLLESLSPAMREAAAAWARR